MRRSRTRARCFVVAAVVAQALLVQGCRPGAEAPPAAPGVPPAGAAASSPGEPDAARLAELKRSVRDPASSPGAKREALAELARLQGKDLPPELARAAEVAPRIEIPLPEGPPRQDPVVPGTYVLTTTLDFDGGQSLSRRQACKLELQGERVTIRIERSRGDPLAGTLRAGLLDAQGQEGDAAIRLRGQVVGQGKLLGAIEGESREKGLRIREGRFRLERVE